MTAKNCTTKINGKQVTTLIYGVACNSQGKHRAAVNSKNTQAYATWYNMLKRCYYQKLHIKQPTYRGCSVSDEWLDFQDFAEWYYSNRYSELGYHLDKDILVPNNKVYKSNACCFIPQELNSLVLDSAAIRGDLPQGVSRARSRNRYEAVISINGRKKRLGVFGCANEAYLTYIIAKEAYVKDKAVEWKDRIDSRVFDALMAWTVE